MTESEVHAHLVIGKGDGISYGEHLQETYVRPTLELVLMESPAELYKQYDPESGLTLIRRL